MNKNIAITLAASLLASVASAQTLTQNITPTGTTLGSTTTSQTVQAAEANWTTARYWVAGAYDFSGSTAIVPASVNNSNTSLTRAPAVAATSWANLAAGNSAAFTPVVVAPWSPWAAATSPAQYISSNLGLTIPGTVSNPSNPIGTINDGDTFHSLGLATGDFRPASNLAGNYEYSLTLPALPTLGLGQSFSGNVTVSLSFSSDNRAGVLFDVGGTTDTTFDFGGTIGTLTTASVSVPVASYNANTNSIVVVVRNSATTDFTAPSIANRPWSNPSGLLVQGVTVEYTVIPEASTWALIVGSLALGFAAWRRRS